MRRPLGALRALCVLLCYPTWLLAVAGPPAREVYVPLWSTGDGWIVEAEISDVRAEAGSGDERRLRPQRSTRMRFAFRVEKVADVGRLRFYSVVVRQVEGGATGAELVFGGEKDGPGVKSLFLVKAVYTYPVKDKVNRVRRDYNKMSTGPFPVFNDVNGVPSDFPYLYKDHGVDPGNTKASGFWKSFQATSTLGGDLRSHAARQTVLFPPLRLKLPAACPLPRDRVRDQEVYLQALPRGPVVRLVFNPAYPWPVYVEGPRGRSHLVKVEKGPSSGQSPREGSGAGPGGKPR